MNTTAIISELESERDRLDMAIAALQEGTRQRKRRGVRKMSAEARKRIGQAQKKRWAAVKAKRSS